MFMMCVLIFLSEVSNQDPGCLIYVYECVFFNIFVGTKNSVCVCVCVHALFCSLYYSVIDLSSSQGAPLPLMC